MLSEISIRFQWIRRLAVRTTKVSCCPLVMTERIDKRRIYSAIAQRQEATPLNSR